MAKVKVIRKKRRVVTDDEVVRKWQSLQHNAKERDIPFSVTLNRVRTLLQNETCFYTGVKFVHHNPQLTRSFDRVVNSLGYEDRNLVVCTKWINTAKANLTMKEFKGIILGITRFCKRHKIKPDAARVVTRNQAAKMEPNLNIHDDVRGILAKGTANSQKVPQTQR